MERNMDRRVEMAFPILDPRLQAQLGDFLEIQLADNVKGRLLHPDGSSQRATPGDGRAVRSQERLYEQISALSSGVQPVLAESRAGAGDGVMRRAGSHALVPLVRLEGGRRAHSSLLPGGPIAAGRLRHDLRRLAQPASRPAF